MRIQLLYRCIGFQLAILCTWNSLTSAQFNDTLQATSSSIRMKDDSLGAGNRQIADNRGFATLKMMATNVVPFTINRYVRKEKFAYITWESLHNNLRLRSWKWDADNFINNQFSHPYHGSLYYNAFRSEGFRFWQSVPAAFAGSLVWEIVAEMETPAINDLVNTTLGGIAWGEVTHRVANKLLQAKRGGRKMKGLHVLGRMVDPMKSFSDWVNPGNKMMRSIVDSTRIHFELSGGSRQYNQAYDGRKLWPKGEWFARLSLQYGAGAEQLKIPFSHFYVMVELGTSDSSFFNIAQIKGNLTGWKLAKNERRHHYVTLNLDYDYYRNTAFRYGMQSFQLGLFSRYRFGRRIALNTEFSTSVIGLAAISDNKPYNGRPRDYDYASGGSVGAGFNLLLLDQFGLRTSNRLGWLLTHDGKLMNYRLINSTSAIYYLLKRRYVFMYEWGHFYLKSRITENVSERSHNYYKRIGIGYRFSL